MREVHYTAANAGVLVWAMTAEHPIVAGIFAMTLVLSLFTAIAQEYRR